MQSGSLTYRTTLDNCANVMKHDQVMTHENEDSEADKLNDQVPQPEIPAKFVFVASPAPGDVPWHC